MLALRSSPPSFGIAEGERIAREQYGLAVSISALAGERDCNFRLRTADEPRARSREFVLKIVDVAADDGGADCLVSVLEHLAEQDPTLPVPRVLPTRQGAALGRINRDGVQFATCLLSFLPGQLLAESSPGEGLLYGMGVMLARIDRALQGYFHPTLTRRLAWDVRRLPELAEFSRYLDSRALRTAVERVAQALRDALARLRGLRSQAIHGDCHAANLLVDSEGRSICGILDFGDMIHAPRIFEPAVAISELLTEAVAPLAASGVLLRGYAQGQAPLQAEEVEALFDVVTARHCITLLVHAWRREHDAAGAALLAQAAALSARSLAQLLDADRHALTRSWHDAAGTSPVTALRIAPGVDLERRHRLMGAGAELFYEQPLHLVRGSGVWLYDPQGRAYLDVYNNVPHVGHTHPAVVAAIQKQTGILATHTRYLHENILEYAERLTARMPPHLDTCIFVNSGSEANDVAWRMARMTTGHDGALVMEQAYHGITEASAALTVGGARPADPRVVTLTPPPAALQASDSMTTLQLAAAADDAERAIARLAQRGLAPAAFFIDTAITSSGIFDPPPAWAQALSAKVRAVGGLIVADEVQYGLGRCGSHFWGFERRGLKPDIVTLGKPVANGYPMGVVVASRAMIEAFQARCGFFSTFGGNAVAAAAGIAVLEVLDEERLMANALDVGGYLRRQLQAMAGRHASLGEVYGAGLLLGLQVLANDAATAKRRNKAIINDLAAKSRILIGYEGPNADILKLRPPMPFGRAHADTLVEAIDAAAARLA